MTQKIPSHPVSGATVLEFPRVQLEETKAESLSAGTVSRNELTSIKALTTYVAHNKKVSESIVCDYLLTEFKVGAVADLRRADYERVVRYLVDLQIDIIVN